MISINSNINSLIAARVLNNNNKALSTSLERLSTGLRINHGGDDPVGLVSSELLRAERVGIEQGIKNGERASNIVGTAEGGLAEIADQLSELQALVSEASNSGGLSTDELQANQQQVDAILSEVNRVSATTTFQGKRLLNGGLDYTVSGVVAANLTNVRVNSAKLAGGTAVALNVNVTQSAQTARSGYTGGTLAALNNVTLEVGGNLGTEQVSIAGGTTAAGIITAVNAVKNSTGLSATLSGAAVRFQSTKLGSDQFVSVRNVSGTFAPTVARGTGRNAIVSINGSLATAQGTNVSYKSSNLDVEFALTSTFNVVGATAFNVTGGGANFQISSRVSEADKLSIGINSVSAGSLGDSTSGFLSTLGTGGANQVTGGNLTNAQTVVDSAIKQVAKLRNRLGNFKKYAVEGTIRNLEVSHENISAAESSIRDTDFVKETANLSRAQILSQTAATSLAQSNASSQNVLRLLGVI